jgi:hypothetical protein
MITWFFGVYMCEYCFFAQKSQKRLLCKLPSLTIWFLLFWRNINNKNIQQILLSTQYYIKKIIFYLYLIFFNILFCFKCFVFIRIWIFCLFQLRKIVQLQCSRHQQGVWGSLSRHSQIYRSAIHLHVRLVIN